MHCNVALARVDLISVGEQEIRMVHYLQEDKCTHMYDIFTISSDSSDQSISTHQL